MAGDKVSTTDWTTWPVDAPDRPFVQAAELARLLGYASDTSITNLVEAGQLPEPLARGGTAVWSREDVIFFVLFMKVRGRLRTAPPELPNKGQNRPKSGKDGQLSPEA